MSNQMYGGSICLTDLNEKAKKGHSAFSKARNGKVYVNMITWVNEKVDEFGNSMSHQLSSTKEMRGKEEKFYMGNSKKIEGTQPVSANDIDDNYEVAERKQETKPAQIVEEPADGLPF